MVSSYHDYRENNIRDYVLKLIRLSLPGKHGCLSLGVSVDIRYERAGFFFDILHQGVLLKLY
jgi:hypothetical protein